MRFVIFERYDLYNRAEYYERLTVCGTEVKYSKIYDNTYTHHGIRDTIDVSEIGYDEYDFYNGGFWFDFTNALSDLGHPVIGNALGFIDVSKDVSLNDIRIAKKKAWSFSHYYYINDEKELVVESNLGELLFF